MESEQSPSVSGVGVSSIVEEYEQRSMSTWSDHDLGVAVVDVVQVPRAGEFDSFVLHAPLETAARAALLAHVTPQARTTARMRMVSLAARYDTRDPRATPPDAIDAGDPVTRLVGAVGQQDADGAEAAARAVARTHDRQRMVAALAEYVIPSTSAASHAPIFLHLLRRSDPRGPVTPTLLAPLARELAREPATSIRWFDGRIGSGPADPARLTRQLMNTPSQSTENNFIRPMVEAVEASGLADDLLADSLGRFSHAAAVGILRVAAMSMLHDTPDEAPYGWTHCMTIPQAVLEIADATPRPDIALAVAATHVAAMRAALGSVVLPERPLDSYPDVEMRDVVDAAATHHDAHVAKYVLACLDAAEFDPEGRNLYHGAAAHLIDVWRERPLPEDPLRDVVTPGPASGSDAT